MTVHDDVNEVPILVLNYLVVPEDARVSECGERRQLEPEGPQRACSQAVEPDLFHGEAWVVLDGAHDAEGPPAQHATLAFTQLPEVENGHTEALQGRIECVGVFVNHAVLYPGRLPLGLAGLQAGLLAAGTRWYTQRYVATASPPVKGRRRWCPRAPGGASPAAGGLSRPANSSIRQLQSCLYTAARQQ